MKMSRDFVSGFGSAVANLGSEGDHRGEDWSAPYEYLKDRLRAFEPVGNDIVERLRLRSREDCETADKIEKLRVALAEAVSLFECYGLVAAQVPGDPMRAGRWINQAREATARSPDAG